MPSPMTSELAAGHSLIARGACQRPSVRRSTLAAGRGPPALRRCAGFRRERRSQRRETGRAGTACACRVERAARMKAQHRLDAAGSAAISMPRISARYALRERAGDRLRLLPQPQGGRERVGVVQPRSCAAASVVLPFPTSQSPRRDRVRRPSSASRSRRRGRRSRNSRNGRDRCGSSACGRRGMGSRPCRP